MEFDIKVSFVFIDMYLKCGVFDLVMIFFVKVLEKSVVFFNFVILGFGLYGFVFFVFEMFNEMFEMGLKFDEVIFFVFFCICCYFGFLREG